MKSYRFEKLKGDREGDYSIRVNDQFRLTFQIEKGDDGNRLVVLNIKDCH
jgi:toxin HigB-1